MSDNQNEYDSIIMPKYTIQQLNCYIEPAPTMRNSFKKKKNRKKRELCVSGTWRSAEWAQCDGRWKQRGKRDPWKCGPTASFKPLKRRHVDCPVVKTYSMMRPVWPLRSTWSSF